jgi:SAM-dependent methyltransferase
VRRALGDGPVEMQNTAWQDVGFAGDGPVEMQNTAWRNGGLAGFDRALAGVPAWLVRDDGVEVGLDPARWRRGARGEDRWLLDRCTGPAIDLGCGPGRFVAALTARGVPALGVDASRVAQRQCRRRRTPMVRRDLFGPLPGEGTWRHVLLADGNIGIGGDPVRLLRRAAALLRPGGTVLVETDARPDALWRGTARLRTAAGSGAPLPWACTGADALGRLAATLGLSRTDGYRGGRVFVELTALTVCAPGRVPAPAAAG